MEKYLKHTKKVGECLEWCRCFNTDGYPRAWVNGSSNGKVHREVFFLANGYYPEVVRHSCDNIKCINPDHLLGGSPEDNNKDRHERNRTYKQYPAELVERVLELRKMGLTHEQVGQLCGISRKKSETIWYRKGLRKES